MKKKTANGLTAPFARTCTRTSVEVQNLCQRRNGASLTKQCTALLCFLGLSQPWRLGRCGEVSGGRQLPGFYPFRPVHSLPSSGYNDNNSDRKKTQDMKDSTKKGLYRPFPSFFLSELLWLCIAVYPYIFLYIPISFCISLYLSVYILISSDSEHFISLYPTPRIGFWVTQEAQS